nr:hypothetical protein [Tanacetum cinerariifolium]
MVTFACCDEFSLPEDFPTASEERFLLLSQKDATAEEVCTADEVKGRTIAVTTEDMQKRRNDVKARTTLLLALPDEHQLRFNKYKTAQELWDAILKTFGGNEATKKTKKNQLKQQYRNFKAEGKKTLEQTFNRLQAIRNRSDLDTMSLDDLYNHLKVYEPEVQKKLVSQNMAFISSAKNNSGNGEVNTASIPTASTQVFPASANVVAASISLDTACAYIAFQSNGSQIKYEDINQIDEDDIKEMDIKWSALTAIRWATLLGSAGHPGAKTRVEEKTSNRVPKALMAIDRVGWDWSYMANKEEDHALVAKQEAPIEFTLMAKSSSDTEVEARLIEFKNQEIKFYEKIRGLEFKVESKDNRIKRLTKELEELKKEKEGLNSKLTGFQSASKDLDTLLGSQRSDKNKEGLGYIIVPPPPAQVYSPPKKDIDSFISKRGDSSESIMSKPMIKFVKATDSPTEVKISKLETVRKPSVKYAKMYRNTTKSPKEHFDGGYVSFGQGGCKITGKGTIKTGKLEFKNVYFVKDLKYNMFSVSQICDNQNSVLFTDSECIMLGRDFKLRDDTNVLLRTPRQHNMYSIDLNHIVPHKDLTCLVTKASADESELWHRRLGHLNFKTINRNFITEIENLKDLKFEAKGDEGYFIGYSMSSKAFRVFNKRTKRVEENLHVDFIKNKLIEKGAGLNWLFDIDTLTNSMNYVPVVSAGTIFTNFLGTKEATSQDVKKDVSSLRYIVLPNWFHEAHLESSTSNAQDACNADASEISGNSNPTATSTNQPADQMETLTVETSIPTVSLLDPTACLDVSLQILSDSRLISKRVISQDDTPSLDNILTLSNRFEDILGVTTNTGDSNGVEADLSKMETNTSASPTPTLRIHMDHQTSQIIGPVDTPVQTRTKSKEIEVQSFIALIHHMTNLDLLQFCLFPCFLSQEEPKKISDALKDPRVRPIGTKGVLKNKKDERGIVIRNKARLVAQGHTQEEGIDYEEVFEPVARIEAIRLFLAYASFIGFTVYQIDVKSAFFYGTIDEEVYVMQSLRFQDPEFLVIVYKVEKVIEFEAIMQEKFQMSAMGELNFFLGLQVLQKKDGIFLSQDKYVGDILKKFGYSDVRSASTPMDKENP